MQHTVQLFIRPSAFLYIAKTKRKRRKTCNGAAYMSLTQDQLTNYLLCGLVKFKQAKSTLQF